MNCGADASECIAQLGTVEAWGPVAVSKREGKLVAERTGPVETELWEFEEDDWHCSECGHQSWKLEKMVKELDGNGDEILPPNPNQVTMLADMPGLHIVHGVSAGPVEGPPSSRLRRFIAHLRSLVN